MPGLSGVGFSFGADRIFDVLNTLDLFPKEGCFQFRTEINIIEWKTDTHGDVEEWWVVTVELGIVCQVSDKQPGFTIVPILVFIDDHGRAKVDIALCKGKKEYDKRQTLKDKEDRREMDRAIKHY